MSFIQLKEIKQFKILICNFFSVILFKKSLPRIVTDVALKQILPQLKGKLIDLGSATETAKDYKKINPQLDYLSTNIKGDFDQYLNMENISLNDSSVDNYLSVYSLEHLSNPEKAINEIYRTLKKDGHLILAVPFMLRMHSLPDFFRFGYDSLKLLMKNFSQIKIYQIGDFDLQVIHYLFPRKYFWSFLCILLITKIIKSIITQDSELREIKEIKRNFKNTYPMCYLIIAKK